MNEEFQKYRLEHRYNASGFGHGLFCDDEIRLIRQDKRSIRAIAPDYNVSPSTIHRIKNKTSYASVTDDLIKSGPVPVPTGKIIKDHIDYRDYTSEYDYIETFNSKEIAVKSLKVLINKAPTAEMKSWLLEELVELLED